MEIKRYQWKGRWTGINVFPITCFTPDLNVDYDAMRKLFRYLVNAGVAGQGVPCAVLEIDDPITYRDGDVEIVAVPTSMSLPGRRTSATRSAPVEISGAMSRQMCPATTQSTISLMGWIPSAADGRRIVRGPRVRQLRKRPGRRAGGLTRCG